MAINGTLTLIETKTITTATAASLTFSSIPQTYDDLMVVAMGRANRSFLVDDLVIQFNGVTTGYTGTRVYGLGTGSGASADSPGDIRGFISDSVTAANTFGSNQFYIPNYRSSTTKGVSVDAVSVDNTASNSSAVILAGSSNVTSAITSITLFANNSSLVLNSTFSLYGISRTPAGVKATGGVISQTSTHWIHTFYTSGIFTPTQSVTADIVVVAGGGSGGRGDTSTTRAGGGGGAGGLLLHSAQALSATNYTVTVGGGGAAISGGTGTNGSNSQFASLTASVGGGYGGVPGTYNGNSGGSGGGGADNNAPGSASPSGQGNAGAFGFDPGSGNDYAGGGGGGAGSAGSAGASGNGGNGGSGADYSSWNAGTLAVGGKGGSRQTTQVAGTANTGTGGAGGYNSFGTSGGSGIVIIRYAK